jgi:hypothetical protein
MLDRAPRVHASIFARLLTIMIIMAVTLLLIVGFFFVFVVFPGATAEAGHALEQYSEGIAATSPDLQAAKAVAHRLSVQIRYEGPRGSWTTADYLPRVADVRKGRIDAPIGTIITSNPQPTVALICLLGTSAGMYASCTRKCSGCFCFS